MGNPQTISQHHLHAYGMETERKAMLTSSKIATVCNINHQSLLRIIEKNLAYFRRYGHCYISSEPYSTNGNKLHKKVAVMDDMIALILLGKTRKGEGKVEKIFPFIKSFKLGKSMEDNFYELLCSFAKPRTISVLREYSVQKYFLDVYIPELSLAIEYDGQGHPYSNDKIREQEIKLALNCAFIRVKHGEEADGIAKITEYYLSQGAIQ